MKINALGGTTKVAVVSNAKLPPSCGSFEGLKVDNMPSFMPTQTLPAYTDRSFAEARTANFKTPNGQVVIVYKTPGAAVSITLPTSSTRNLSIYACGFGTLRATSSSPLPSLLSQSSSEILTVSS